MVNDELRDKGFNFPFLLHNLIADVNSKKGEDFIEGVTRLYDNIVGAYDQDGDFEEEIEHLLALEEKEANKKLRNTAGWVPLTAEAKAAVNQHAKQAFLLEYKKARLVFRRCLSKIEDLMPEKIIHGIIEDEDS